MSDSGVDIDDELLELAGATEKKRKRRQTHSSKSSSKRRKADVSMETDPEDGPESEEDESNAYPLEGKYIDESDRDRLMALSEFEREATLAQRQEEMQRIQDKRNLDQMLKEQTSRNGDRDSVSKAAKRQHTIRGATKEKSRKLDELKAKRKAKGDKKRTKTSSPKRDRSSSPMDMETSSGEEEDGQITKHEEEDEKDRKLFGKSNPDDEPIMLPDLEKCRLSRDSIAKYCMRPWFGEYVKGSWVRFLIGNEQGEPVYRICEITSLVEDSVKPYKLDGQPMNQAFELKHGVSVKTWAMDKVSNSSFQQKEFDRLVKVCGAENVKLPSKRHLEKKTAEMSKLIAQPTTDKDIDAMLARKNRLQPSAHQGQKMALERSRLTQAKTLAQRQQDHRAVEQIDEELTRLNETAGSTTRVAREETTMDMLAKVNERNRKANVDAVRQSELLMVERKKRARMLAASGPPAPGSPVPQDPSVRLKTIPRTFNPASPSRPGTPNLAGTPPQSATRPVSPLPSSSSLGKSGNSRTFEAAVIDSIEIDLGDF